mgnify:CR=1 FL=1
MSFDFEAAVQAPFRMQPGLRRLEAGAVQLTPLAPGSRHQREKIAVLSAHAPHALAVQPDFDATVALHALAAHAAQEHAGAFAWDGKRAIAHHLGVAVADDEPQQLQAGVFGLGDEIARCLAGLPIGWRLAGLLCLAFAEDFAIVDGAVYWPAPGQTGASLITASDHRMVYLDLEITPLIDEAALKKNTLLAERVG